MLRLAYEGSVSTSQAGESLFLDRAIIYFLRTVPDKLSLQADAEQFREKDMVQKNEPN